MSSIVIRSVVLAGCLAGAAACFVMSAEPVAAVEPQAKSTFKDIEPILKRNCVSCHNASVQRGKLRLDTFAETMKGGESGKVIVAGKANDSLLIMFLDGRKKPLMPFKKAPLPKADIDKLSKWINDGALEK